MIRAGFPESTALLAAATAAANAAQIVATHRAQCRPPAPVAIQLPSREWTEERAIACDLRLNEMKTTGEYDARRSGGRAWA